MLCTQEQNESQASELKLLKDKLQEESENKERAEAARTEAEAKLRDAGSRCSECKR